VLEALKAGRALNSVLVRKDGIEGTLKLIVAKAREGGAVVKELSREKLDAISETGKHQGVIAYASAHQYAEVSDILAAGKAKGREPFIIIADGITDPRNLGAIIRTAYAAGADGLIIPERRAAALTPAAAKASAGAVNYLPVARAGNIPRLIEKLKAAGVWVACLDMSGEDIFGAPDGFFTGAAAVVVGGEGGGASRLTREKCDYAYSIPMTGSIDSLNASVAAALAMYEVRRRRGRDA
jgi:23S rRNA (guanosine2251-2'-O)-methyltransferase